MIAAHLAPPPREGVHTHGVVRFDATTNHYEVEAEPAVLQAAKRLFPGCAGKRSRKTVRFAATRRAVGDLNWLLLRYPMRIECAERFEADRQRAVQHAERRAALADLKPTRPPLTFKGTLLDYQAEGVTFLAGNERALLADDMGLGKTVTALATIAAAEAFPALVVAPTNVQLQWCRSAETFLDLPSGMLLHEQAVVLRGKRPHRIPDTPIVVIHYGLIDYWKTELIARGFKSVIFDEVQELRHTGTGKYSAATLISESVQMCVGLSGTPIYNYGAEMWAIMNAIDFQCLGDFESFTREWCTGYGEKIIENPEALGDHLRREGLMLRRLKTDVQSQLPPRRNVVMDIEHDEGVYRRLALPAVAAAKGFDSLDFHGKGEAARKITEQARHAAGAAKAPQVADFVETLIAAGERPLVFAWHHDVHDLLAERLEKHARLVRITGRETQPQKAEAVRAFAAGEADAVLLSLRSTAGLDGLQGRGTCVVFAELDWSPAVHAQCVDRLHRIGVQADSVLAYFMISSTSYDLVIQETLGLKVGQFTALMGDPGTSVEKRAEDEHAAETHLKRLVQRLREAA